MVIIVWDHGGDGSDNGDEGGLEGWKVAVICVFSIVGGIIVTILAVIVFVWARKRVQKRDYEIINNV